MGKPKRTPYISMFGPPFYSHRTLSMLLKVTYALLSLSLSPLLSLPSFLKMMSNRQKNNCINQVYSVFCDVLTFGVPLSLPGLANF